MGYQDTETNQERLPLTLDLDNPPSKQDIEVLLKIAAQCRLEFNSKPSPQTKFNFAWILVRSSSKIDQERGVQLLEEIYKENPSRRRECLYYLSLGSFKLEKYSAARDYVNSLLQVDPHNQQATRLKDLIAEKVNEEGLIGMALVGGAVALVGGIAAAIFAGQRRR